VTVSRQEKYWFVSIQVEMECPKPVHSSTTMLGVDMGVKRLLTLSNGDFSKPIDVSLFKEKIKCLQKRLARMLKFSNNGQKVKKKSTDCILK
jgi:putative transposase